MESKSKRLKKVLIVEDEPPLRNILQVKLKEEGFTATTAIDGNEAIAALKKTHFDLVLLDIVMPIMDGFQTLEAMKKAGINVPTIVLSNVSQGLEKNRAKKLGVIGYIVKSDTTLAEIIEQVRHLP